MFKTYTRKGYCARWILLFIAVTLLSSCAPVAQERPRFFWPIAQPKIEYINFFQSADDVRRGTENWLAESILGKEIPRPIFVRPGAIASDGRGRVFVTDQGKNEVFIFDFIRHQVRTFKSSSGKRVRFGLPSGVAVDASGQAYVVDSTAAKVLIFGEDEKLKKTIGDDNLSRPTGVAVDSSRQRLFVVDTGAHQLEVFDLQGNWLYALGERGSAPGTFNYPLDADLDAQGNLYVLDSMNARVQVFDPQGSFLRAFGERGTAPGAFQIAKGIAVSPSGHVYVTDAQAHHLVIFDLEGNYLLTIGSKAVVRGNVQPGGFYLPQGIDVDSSEAIWIVDSFNRMFHQFQYLNEAYLAEHPILPGQAFMPKEFSPSSTAGQGGNRQ